MPQTADGTAAGSKITAAEVVSRKDYEDRHGFCRLNEVLENLYYMVAYNVGLVRMLRYMILQSLTISVPSLLQMLAAEVPVAQ